MDYKSVYESWINNPYFDEETKNELLALKGNDTEIEDRFYTELSFGTAGLRGVMGAGTNRMNIYTVGKATQGLADYINKQNGANKGVAIAYDSRNNSREFALAAALCLCANGIRAYLFDSLRPTPELSFAIRHLGCVAGINITASHNPAEYNGYKVYWEDGAQITPPHDTGIMECVKAVTDYSTIKAMRMEEASEKGLFRYIGKEVDDAYMAKLHELSLRPDALKENASKIKVVYTPLHGTGNLPVRRILSELGFTNVTVVPEQELPDGNFPTVGYPNPETAKAFELGLKLAKEIKADLVLATDPDADRLGVYVLEQATGEYHALTGNMSGCLIGDYILSSKLEKEGSLPKDGAFIKSIVTTNLADGIAEYYGINLIEVLTGFKYIGQQILEFEKTGKGTYLFGMEESYGCLPGTYARDKDAVAASMLLCEAAAYYKSKNMTLYDAMQEIYKRVGFYFDGVESFEFKGVEGREKINGIMAAFRGDSPESLGGLKVVSVRDYSTGIIKDVLTNEEKPTGQPKSDVMYFDLEDNAWACVRPSGTEPKIKFYYGARGKDVQIAQEKASKIIKDMKNVL